MSRVLFVVTARGGSKGLARKNLRELAGIPLVGWAARNAARAARATPGSHAIVCSTDDPAIAAAARAWGADTPFERPAELATDGASSVDVVLHAVDCLGGDAAFDAVCVVQPTSPLALGADVAAAVSLFLAGDGAPVVTATRAKPARWVLELDGDRVVSGPEAGDDRRQKHRPCVVPNGAAFVAEPARLRRTRRFLEPGRSCVHLMPAQRGVDVDDAEDLAVCAALLAVRPAAPFQVAGRRFGTPEACLVLAEPAEPLAEGMEPGFVAAASDAGADAVVLSPGAADAGLAERAAGAGVLAFARPADAEQARRLSGRGVAAFDAAHAGTWLAELASPGRPVVLGTSGRPLAQIDADLARLGGGEEPSVALLVEPAAPGTGAPGIGSLLQAFGRPVAARTGSDPGLAALAVGAGAALVLVGGGPADLARSVAAVRAAERAAGRSSPAPSPPARA